MPGIDKSTTSGLNDIASDEQWPGITSRFLLVVVAALRNKQLLYGSRPRIEADSRKRRNTSIALEEVKQGLVPFALTDRSQADDHHGSADPLHLIVEEQLETVGES
jgi:DNA-directed RNA polymerase omega subunit